MFKTVVHFKLQTFGSTHPKSSPNGLVNRDLVKKNSVFLA